MCLLISHISLCASTGLHDHVRDVCFDDVVLRVKVHHGEWPTLGGNAAGGNRRVDAVDFQLAEDGGVEGGRYARGAGQVLRTLTHAVVHVVPFGRDDPVVPLDVLELDVELSLAAHGDVLAAVQRALPQQVFGKVVPETHLGHQEGLVGAACGAVQGAKVLPVLVAGDLQPQLMLVAVQEGLQGASDGEGVPVVLVNLQHLLHHQCAVQPRNAFLSRQEDPGREAWVPVGVLGGAGVDPQRGLQDLNTFSTFLQELESEAQTRLTTTLICEEMPKKGPLIIKHGRIM